MTNVILSEAKDLVVGAVKRSFAALGMTPLQDDMGRDDMGRDDICF
jgi:hypothetical protein